MALYSGQPFQGLMAKIRILKPIKLLNKLSDFHKDMLHSLGTRATSIGCRYPAQEIFIDRNMAVFTCT